MLGVKGYFFSLFAGIFFISSCLQKSDHIEDPKRRLTGYISRSFAINSVSDRNDLENYLTGDAKYRLRAWSDEQFRLAFVESKRKFLKLVVKEVKNVSDTEVNLTYELSYIDNTNNKEVKITNKKMAQMTKQNQKWYIREVRNIKALVEYKDELSLP